MNIVARAKSKYIKVSPYKLRSFVAPIRGCSVSKALAFLKDCSLKRVVPIAKTIFSAYSNAIQNKDLEALTMDDFFVKEIFVDQGPTIKYAKPAAMGRSSVQRRRLSHIQVVIAKK